MTRIQDWMTLATMLLSMVVVTSCSAQPNNEETEGRTVTRQQASASNVGPVSHKNDWSRFRGPGGLGVSHSTGLPVTWSEDENIAWQTDLPGAGASSPIVIGDHIYVTCYSGYFIGGDTNGNQDDLKRHLICLNREDGTFLWDKSIKAKLPEEERIRDHGYAANTPVADADRVYAFFGKSGVIAFDHDGNQLWEASVGTNTHGWGTAASPILYGDLVLINASVESESLVALDRKTGEEKWRTGGIKEAWNTPLVVKTDAGEEEIVLAIHGKVLGFDPASGKQLWSCETDITWYMAPSAVAADGIVYFLGGRSGTASLAVRTGGRGDVTGTHRLWTSLKGSNVTSPVFHEGHLYWMHEKLSIVYCAQADTGELVYEERVNRGGQAYASALLAEDKLYYLNRTGRMFVVAAKPEFELLSTNSLNDRSLFNASPVPTGHQILIRSDKTLYCVGE